MDHIPAEASFCAELLDALDLGVILSDAQGRVRLANRRATELLDFAPGALVGQSLQDFVGFFLREDRSPLPVEELASMRVLRSGQPVSSVTVSLARDPETSRRWLTVNARPIHKNGALDGVLATFFDVTAFRQTLDSLRQSEANVKNILAHTPLGVCVTDAEGLFEQVNEAYCRLYGYAREELIGRHFTMVVPEEHRKFLSDLHDDFIANGTEIRGEWQVLDKLGRRKTIIADAARISQDGAFKKVTFVMDISEKKRQEQELQEKNRQLEDQARTDSLTGMHNRAYAFERLEDLARQHRRYGAPFCVSIVDVDHFKTVNDTHGHAVGDQVLRALARAIKEHSRDTDVVARFGGEEFLLLLPHTELAGAVRALENIRRAVADLSMTSKGISRTISAGVAQYEGGETTALLEAADQALYRAKDAGRDRVEADVRRPG